MLRALPQIGTYPIGSSLTLCKDGPVIKLKVKITLDSQSCRKKWLINAGMEKVVIVKMSEVTSAQKGDVKVVENIPYTKLKS